ncbi:MAG: adenylosuccinate lyase family protein [Pseudomonadota bacterium]
MTVSCFDSAIYGGLFSDPDLSALFDDAAEMRTFAYVEGALARAQGALGVIPPQAAARIEEVCRHIASGEAAFDPNPLREGARRDGVAIPSFVAELRAAVGADAAPYVHWGLTSQCVVDTAMICRVADALEIFEARLLTLSSLLADLTRTHEALPMPGRTRGMHATPTTFGLKCAVWRAPLMRHLSRLEDLRDRALCLSVGGATGTMAALGPKALEIEAAMAQQLDLSVTPVPWHAARDGVLEVAGWMAQVAASLGKIAKDVADLASSDVGEVTIPGGGSSTMPNKINPVAPEAIVTLAHVAFGRLSDLQHAAMPLHERGGASWMVEWVSLPILAVASGTALARSIELIEGLKPRPERMRANLDASNGLILAEHATFALAEHMPRPQAADLVKAACADAATSGRHLFDILAERAAAPIDWSGLRDPASAIGHARTLARRAVGDA